MARYTGPKWRVSRAYSFPIFGDDKYQRRSSKPGQHARPSRRSSSTTYSVQFAEKQKVKKMYGLTERQFSNLFKKASKSKHNTGLEFLQLLETRLDNVVYRAGLAMTRPQARQFVSHGHITVNGKKLDIPSYQVLPGQEIRLISKISDTDTFKLILENLKTLNRDSKWIEALDKGCKVKALPEADMLDKSLNVQLIIEFYNR